MANKFSISPMGGMNLALQYSDMSQKLVDKQEEINEQSRLQNIHKQAAEIYKSGDINKMLEFSLQNPEIGDMLLKAGNYKKQMTDEEYEDMLFEAVNSPSTIPDKIQNFQGISDKRKQELIKLAEEDPDELQGALMKQLAWMNPEKFKKWRDALEAEGNTLTPMTPMGKLNADFLNNKVSKGEYETLRSQLLEGGGYAPTNLAKLIKEREKLIQEGFAKDSPEVKAYDRKISGVDVEIEDLTPEAISYYGYQVYKQGNKGMPSFGRGKEATRARVKVSNAAAKWAYFEHLQSIGAEIPEGMEDGLDLNTVDMAMNSIESASNIKAVQGSLNFLEKQHGAMDSFIQNLSDQVDRVGKLQDSLEKAGVSFLNKPLYEVRKLLGRAEQNELDMFLGEISRETSKLATGSTQSIAAPAVEETKFWDKVHDKDLPWGEMVKLLDATKAAAQIRMKSVEDSITRAKGRLRTPGTVGKGEEQPKATISEIPAGSKYLGTSGGKPVYETPDGKKFIGE